MNAIANVMAALLLLVLSTCSIPGAAFAQAGTDKSAILHELWGG